jgi:hypothetical protein
VHALVASAKHNSRIDPGGRTGRGENGFDGSSRQKRM